MTAAEAMFTYGPYPLDPGDSIEIKIEPVQFGPGIIASPDPATARWDAARRVLEFDRMLPVSQRLVARVEADGTLHMTEHPLPK